MDRLDFFKVSGREMFWNLLTTPSASWHIWTLAIVGVSVFVFGCLFDVRIMVLGLLICSSMVPPVVMYMYFSHVLDTYMIANVLNHTVERCSDGYRVRIYREVDDAWVEAAAMTVLDSKIAGCRNRGAYSVLYLEDSPIKVLYVPNSPSVQPTPNP